MKYEVHAGDTPWKIAVKLVGNGFRWPELIAANSDKPLGGTPGHETFLSLRPTEKLNIPESWICDPAKGGTKEPEEESEGAWSTPSWEEP